MKQLALLRLEPHHSGRGLSWTFAAHLGDRDTQITAHTSPDGLIFDVLTDDGYCGGTGDQEANRLVGEHIQRVLAFHDALRTLDAIRPARSGRTRWAA